MGNLAQIFGATGFDPASVPQDDTRSLIPKGKQPMMIIDSEVKTTKAGDGQYVKLVHEIIDGQYKGRKIFVNLNIQNKNPDTERIAQQRLSALSVAVGAFPLVDSTMLHNKPFMGDVIISKSGDQNDVAGYASFSGSSVRPTLAGGTAPGKLGAAASHATTAASTSQSVAASPSSATPPWKR